jgi:hypothetical protein
VITEHTGIPSPPDGTCRAKSRFWLVYLQIPAATVIYGRTLKRAAYLTILPALKKSCDHLGVSGMKMALPRCVMRYGQPDKPAPGEPEVTSKRFS